MPVPIDDILGDFEDANPVARRLDIERHHPDDKQRTLARMSRERSERRVADTAPDSALSQLLTHSRFEAESRARAAAVWAERQEQLKAEAEAEKEKKAEAEREWLKTLTPEKREAWRLNKIAAAQAEFAAADPIARKRAQIGPLL